MLIRLIFIFCITIPAYAYNLTQDFTNGFYWASLPVKFIIKESDPARKELLTKLTEAAIKQWEEETGLAIWELALEGTGNIIRWSSNFGAETRMDPASVLAVAIRYTDGPYFAKSEIIINGTHSAFNSMFDSTNNMNIGTTLVHELGHTMGIDHSEVSEAVMAPTLQYPYTGLHTDDLDGMTDAFAQTEKRQTTRYVSPLAYSEETKSTQALNCGSTGPATGGMSANAFLSLVSGLLISFVRKLTKWFKSLF